MCNVHTVIWSKIRSHRVSAALTGIHTKQHSSRQRGLTKVALSAAILLSMALCPSMVQGESVHYHWTVKPNLDGSGTSRHTYHDYRGIERYVASTDDGLLFQGDSGKAAAVTLNYQVNITGGVKESAKLTDNNIGVVTSQDQNGDDGIIAIKLAKNLNLGSDGSLAIGNMVMNNAGFTLGNISFTIGNMSFGGNVLHNVGAGTAGTDAVNVSQLNSAISGIQLQAGEGISVTRNGTEFTVAANVGSSDTVKKYVDGVKKDDANQSGPDRRDTVQESGGTGTDTQTVNVQDLVNDTAGADTLAANGTTVRPGVWHAPANNETQPTTQSGGQITMQAEPYHFYDDSSTKGSPARSEMLGGNLCFRGDGNISTEIKAETDPATGLSSGTKIKFHLNQNLNVDSVTMGDTVINKEGLTVGGNTYVTSDGLNANGQKVVNVADGAVSAVSKDAVNGSQLYATNQAVTNLGGEVNRLSNRVNRVGAGAAALAALHPQDFDPDDKWDFAAGYGNYKDANAVAIGAFYRPNDKTMFSVGGSFGGGENMVNAGISFKFGHSSEYAGLSLAELVDRLRTKDAEMEQLKAKSEEQDQRIEKLEAMVEKLAAK